MITKYIYKTLAIAVIMIAIATQTQAQSAPGLLGKRLVVSYDYGFYFNLRFNDLLDLNTNGEASILETISGLTVSKHYFAAEYMLSKRLSVGVGYNFYRRDLNPTSIGANNRENNFQHDIRAAEYSVHFKYFSKRSIAPIGFYHQGRIFAFDYTSRLTGEEDFFGDEPPIYVFDEATKLGLAYTFGKQGIIFKNVLYNIGCEIGAITVPIFADDSDLSSDLRTSILLDNLFKVKVGIAVPIF